MSDALHARFRKLGNFPSPPSIAQAILALAKNPDAKLDQVAAVIGKDPAIAAKVLRIANSPLYAQRRQCASLRQALMVMGLDSVLTLCLGFSITASLRAAKSHGIDYPAYWRRSLLAALAARCVCEALEFARTEDVFLAGLLQDIGIVALDRAQPTFYAKLAANAAHYERIGYERAELGEDHAELGAWLLAEWQLPDNLVVATRYSHRPEAGPTEGDPGRFVRCIALGSDLADALLGAEHVAALQLVYERAHTLTGLDAMQMSVVVERVLTLSQEIGDLFDTRLLSVEDIIELTEDAQSLLADRNLSTIQEMDVLRASADQLAARTEELAAAGTRDSLTGVYNRGYFDERFAAEFAAAVRDDKPLALLFIDLDHFKQINDRFGHQAGDEVLRSVCGHLRQAVRSSDLVARYGGEEFVLLLPGATAVAATGLGERLLATLRTSAHSFNDQKVVVTASIGLAVHAPQSAFASASALLGAADAAVYAAKHGGRDRLVAHSPNITVVPLSAKRA